jgi:tetratricopeptide (TPR) repeat protein
MRSDSHDLLSLQATLVNNWGNCEYNLGHLRSAVDLYERSLELRQEIGNEADAAGSLNNLSLIARMEGDYANAEELLKLARQINERHKNNFWAAINLDNLGICAYEQATYSQAEPLLTEALKRFDHLENRSNREWGMAMVYGDLGNLYAAQADLGRAAACHGASLALHERLKDRKGLAVSLDGFTEIARQQGNTAASRERALTALGLWSEIGDRRGVAFCLLQLAHLSEAEGNLEDATRALAISSRIRQELGCIVPPRQKNAVEQLEQRTRAAVGSAEFQQALDASTDADLGTCIDDFVQRASSWRDIVASLTAPSDATGV